MPMKKLDRKLVDATGFNPYYHALETALGETVAIDHENYIDLASNNYLGLANAGEIKAYAIKMLERYGLSMCGTPVATGYTELLRNTEAQLASFIGVADAIVLPSCYQANIGLFDTLADSETVIFVDHYAHSSLIKGIQGSGAKVKPFLHNRAEHLEKCLKHQKGTQLKLVVTESVFSTEGSLAPLEDIQALCLQYGAIPIVDDSHGIGVLGSQGRGALSHFGLKNYTGLYTASLGKGMGNIGGVIGGDRDTLDYMRYYCPHLVYSTAVTPVNLGGIAKSIEVVLRDHAMLMERAKTHKETIACALAEAGFPVLPSETLINSIHTGTAENTFRMAKAFYAERLLTTPFVEPSVPPNEGKLRLIAGADFSQEAVNTVCERIRRIGAER